MHVDEQQIVSVSRDIWSSMLGLEIDTPRPEGASTGERVWAGQVQVTGPWQGTIVLECPESVARHAAAMLVAADGEQASADEIKDALEELTARLAERVRALMPGAGQLSKPAVLEPGRREPLEARRGRAVELSCEGRPVRISLFEADAVTAD